MKNIESIPIRSDLEDLLRKYLAKKLSKFKNISKTDKQNYVHSLSSITAQHVVEWLSLNIPDSYRNSILKSLKNNDFDKILESFNDEIFYGTSSIRAKMVSSQDSKQTIKDLKKLSSKTFFNDNIQGTNTFNVITLLIFGLGLVNYIQKNNYKKIIIGYDNRIQSKFFAELLHHFFKSFKINIKIYDKICSTPELVFSITQTKSDLGIMITASHNDKRYNGIKIYTKLGSQPTSYERKKILNCLSKNNKKSFDIISNFLSQFKNGKFKLHIKNNSKINSDLMLSKYIDYLMNLTSKKSHLQKNHKNMKIAFASINGTGFQPASKLFQKMGIKTFYIHSLIKPDPLFSFFKTDQILEPSNESVNKKILSEFISEYGKKKLYSLDGILFTDPDSDRIGLICKIDNKIGSTSTFQFITANEIWALILNFYLESTLKNKSKHNSKYFIVKSFVTSDILNVICKKFNVKCLEGNVGFSSLNEIVKKKWKNDMINIGMFEESNGYAIAGHPKYQKVYPHLLEKDGIFGMLKIIEFLSFIKSKNISLSEMLNNLYLDKKIGYYYNFRTQLPDLGSFDNTLNNLAKHRILDKLKKFSDNADKCIKNNKPLKISKYEIIKIKKYKIPSKNNFPFEGIRFFLNSNDNHITIRSSATESKIRLFLQLKHTCKDKNELIEKKILSEKIKNELIDEIQKVLKLSDYNAMIR